MSISKESLRDDHIAIVERLTRLETEYQRIEEVQSQTSAKLDTLLQRFDKYEAKWGGIVMVASALLGLLVAFKNELLRWLRGL